MMVLTMPSSLSRFFRSLPQTLIAVSTHHQQRGAKGESGLSFAAHVFGLTAVSHGRATENASTAHGSGGSDPRST